MKIKNITAIATAILGFSNINTRKKQILIPYNMKKILLALTIGLTAMACRDKESKEPQDQLPPITQHGANTAGVVINGMVIIPKNRISHIPGSGVIYGLQTFISIDNTPPPKKISYIEMSIANTSRKDDYSFFMKLDTVDTPKTYYTNDFKDLDNIYERKLPYVRVNKYKNGGIEKFYYSDKNSCKITFNKIDLQNGIISGFFSGEVYNEQDKNDKVSITDGRFDININTLNK